MAVDIVFKALADPTRRALLDDLYRRDGQTLNALVEQFPMSRIGVMKVFEIYIKTTPERLWEAITDSETRGKFQFGNRVTSTWQPGSHWKMGNPSAAAVLAEGENLEVDPPRRLVQSMIALWGDDVKSEGTSRVTWEIEPVGDSCRLIVTHDQLGDDANAQLYGGWPMILSGLKTWLEVGEVLTTPGSLMYG